MLQYEKQPVTPQGVPKPLGPYSPCVRVGPFIFVSGQGAMDPATGDIKSQDIAAQTRATLLNLKAVLEGAGSSLDRVVKTTVFLRDVADFEAMNRVYAEFFAVNPPARSCVEVSGLVGKMRIEIEAIALLGTQAGQD
ncbi:MAG: RidA family protein [Betaproteobacteria bacterium]